MQSVIYQPTPWVIHKYNRVIHRQGHPRAWLAREVAAWQRSVRWSPIVEPVGRTLCPYPWWAGYARRA